MKTVITASGIGIPHNAVKNEANLRIVEAVAKALELHWGAALYRT